MHGRADPDEVAQQREALGRGLLGMALGAEDVALLHEGDERRAVLADAEHDRAGRRARRRTSARGRRPPGPAAPSIERRRALPATRSSSRCAATSGRACRAARSGPASRPSPVGALVLVGAARTAAACRGTARSPARRRPRARARSRRGRARAGGASPPGTRRRPARRARRRRAARRGRRSATIAEPTCSNALATERRLPIP